MLFVIMVCLIVGLASTVERPVFCLSCFRLSDSKDLFPPFFLIFFFPFSLENIENLSSATTSVEGVMGVWRGVAMDSLKFHPGPSCPTLLCPVGGPSLKRPYKCFRGGLLAGRVAGGRLLPPWTPYAVRLCFHGRS
jgi:hypothetical protein